MRDQRADAADAWTLGPGEPTATLSGTAEAVDLVLWRRAPAQLLAAEGDLAAIERVLTAGLTP